MTVFDEMLAMSKWNMINVDLGHYVAAGNVGGSPIQFLEKHHARIASFHLKDRTLPEHCSLTFWGEVISTRMAGGVARTIDMHFIR